MVKRLAIAAALLACASAAHAATVDTSRRAAVTRIDTLALTSTRWTGWIPVTNFNAVEFHIDFVDANSSVEAVTMVCETSLLGTEANDGGRELTGLTCNGTMTCLSNQLQWCETGSNTTCGGTDGTAPGSLSWTWVVDDIPGNYINCAFGTSGGTPAAADTIKVQSQAKTP